MKGKLLMGLILIAASLMGVGLWYFTQIAHYHRINGLSALIIDGQSYAVRDYQGLDGDSSPLKLRACFKMDWPLKGVNPAPGERATPLIAPNWFDCFDAQRIGEDLASGAAIAILASKNKPFGFDRYIAHYPDGQAYMWRQINRCGARYFAGQAMPVDCPVPDSKTAAKRVMIDPQSELFTLKLTVTKDKTLSPLRISGKPKIAAASNGRNFYACLRTPSSQALLSKTYMLAPNATPPKTRGHFPCFDTKQIQVDIKNGTAIAFLGQRNIIQGFDRIIAIYPDGMAYAWHQRGTR